MDRQDGLPNRPLLSSNMTFKQKAAAWTFLVLALFIGTFGIPVLIYIIAVIFTVIFAAYLAVDAHFKEMVAKNPIRYQILNDKNLRFNFMAGYSPNKFVSSLNSPPNQSDEESGSQSPDAEVLTGDPAIDSEMFEILGLFFRDYVYSWYSYVSPDEEFPRELRNLIKLPIKVLSKRLRNIDRLNYFTHNIVDDFASHLRLYRQALSREQELKIDTPDTDLQKIFFELERLMDKNVSRENVCKDDDHLFDYLINITNVLLYLTIPPDSFNNRTSTSLIKSLSVNTVLLPLIQMLGDPDYVNQCLIWICQKRAHQTLSIDSFLGVIRCSDSSEELNSVKELVDQEAAILRSRDTGGEDDFDVKQQLNSLVFLDQVIVSRLKSLADGNRKDSDSSADIVKNMSDKMINLPFEVVLKNNVSLSHFIEFMSAIGAQGYVFFYLNVEGFKFSAEQKLASIRDLNSMSEEDMDKMDSLRAAASNIFETYLSSQKQSSQKLVLSTEIVKKIEDRLRRDDLDGSLFDEACNQCYEVMRDREIFYPSFQRSIGYIKMLEDLDLLKGRSSEDVDIGQQTSEGCEEIPILTTPPEYLDIEPVYTSKPRISGKIDSTGVVNEFGNSYAVYAITVETRATANSKQSKWCTLRRYSDFFNFHQQTVQKFPQLTRLQFPAKRTFNTNMNQEFLEQRKHLLDAYLQQILRITENRKDIPDFEEHVMRFLEPGNYNQRDKPSQIFAKTVDKLVLNPFKSVGGVVKAGSDNLRDKLTKFGSSVGQSITGQTKLSPTQSMPRNLSQASGTISSPTANRSTLPSSASFSSLNSTSSIGLESSKMASIDLDSEENIPLRIMLLLMDEVFDLRSKNQWLRRRIVAVIRQIIQATSGDAINKKIVDFVEDSTNSDAVVRYLIKLKNSLWPCGFKAMPHPERDNSTKMRTRVVAKAMLISSLSDDLKHIIGSETTRKGLLCLFDMFQEPVFNRRLILVIFESLIHELFPENHFPQIFQRLHSVRSVSENEECSGKWPPHLAKFLNEAGLMMAEEPSTQRRCGSTRS